MTKQTFHQTISMPEGMDISLQIGGIAEQADATVLVRSGNALLLAAVTSREESEPLGFLPLFVEYQEKFAGAGKIPGGFFRRETRPSTDEILIARMVDRMIRPCFPEGYTSSIQVTLQLLSSDAQVSPESLAALGASAALSCSGLPFQGPVSGVMVARDNAGNWLINPSPSVWRASDLNLLVGAGSENLLMIEGAMDELPEKELIQAIRKAHEVIKQQCAAQAALQADWGVLPAVFSSDPLDQNLQERMKALAFQPCYKLAEQALPSKKKRAQAFDQLLESILGQLAEEMPDQDPSVLSKLFKQVKSDAIRQLLFDKGQRLDGRTFDEIRPISIIPNFVPSAHGSAFFKRGETEALSTVTLGSKLDEQMIDRAQEKRFKRLMLHYNFPGYSTGDVKPQRGQSRREIGHGNLALRALERQVPPEQLKQFTVRIDTDILAANGSSSMATTCAAALALRDTGIPIKQLVAGVAMGLFTDAKTGKTIIVSDILGEEDSFGDMDLKVTGTSKGITACQMDIKIPALSDDLLEQALMQAYKARCSILDRMTAALPEPRQTPKPHTPCAVELSIPARMIGSVIGPGGKVIQQLQEESGAQISISDEGKRGIVHIFAFGQESLRIAQKRIEEITRVPKVGEVYTGTIKGIKSFGLFVEFLPAKQGLLHISQISNERLNDLSKLFKIGDEITVKITEEKQGKYSLSRKILLESSS